MRNLFWLLFIGFFFLNPGVACTGEPDYQYGAEELRAAVEGDWSLTMTPNGAAPIAVTVHITQATTPPGAAARAPGRSLVRAAYACGTRTLVKGAAACADSTEMPLAIGYVSGDAALAEAKTTGAFHVYGLTFTSGELVVAIGPYYVHARIDANGAVISSSLSPNVEAGITGTATLSRS